MDGTAGALKRGCIGVARPLIGEERVGRAKTYVWPDHSEVGEGVERHDGRKPDARRRNGSKGLTRACADCSKGWRNPCLELNRPVAGKAPLVAHRKDVQVLDRYAKTRWCSSRRPRQVTGLDIELDVGVSDLDGVFKVIACAGLHNERAIGSAAPIAAISSVPCIESPCVVGV